MQIKDIIIYFNNKIQICNQLHNILITIIINNKLEAGIFFLDKKNNYKSSIICDQWINCL